MASMFEGCLVSSKVQRAAGSSSRISCRHKLDVAVGYFIRLRSASPREGAAEAGDALSALAEAVSWLSTENCTHQPIHLGLTYAVMQQPLASIGSTTGRPEHSADLAQTLIMLRS